MADAQVPPEAGDAKSGSARRQALRLRDAENVAATRLDMFGDPTLKEVLANQAPGPGEEALPSSAPEADGEPLQPADAGPDSARLAIPDEPLPEAPAPASLPPPEPPDVVQDAGEVSPAET